MKPKDSTALPAGITYLVYTAAGLGLALAVWAIVLALQKNSPAMRLKQLAAKTDFTSKLVENASFRAVTMNYGSLVSNLLFAAMKAGMGIVLHSSWFGVLAGYYIILCIARFFLIKGNRKLRLMEDPAERMMHEWKIFRQSGLLLGLTTLFLQAAVLHLVYTNHGYSYDGMLIYLVAMFASFGSGTELRFQQRMNGITGTCVCLILLAMGIYMLAAGQRKLKELRKEH